MPGNTIEETVIQKLITRLSLIAGAPYNTDFGGRVYRARRDLPTLPGLSIYPQPTQTVESNLNYDQEIFDLPIRIEALSEYLEIGEAEFNNEKADKQSIKVKADIYEALFAKTWRLNFIGGEFADPTKSELDLIGVELPGDLGGFVASYFPASPWNASQSGYIDCIRVEDATEFAAEAMTIGDMTCTSLLFTEIDLDILPADKIEWKAAGIEVYPETIDRPVTTVIDIIVRYWHDKGDPYTQTS